MTAVTDESTDTTNANVLRDWLGTLEGALSLPHGRAEAVSRLFLRDGWWRDTVGLAWDLRTLHGTAQIERFVDELQHELACVFSLDEQAITVTGDPASMVEAYFSFETAVGTGRGIVRLVPSEGDWLAFTFLTALDELKDHPRPLGHLRQSGQEPGKGLWHEERASALGLVNGDPEVVIIGAGQSGLALAAELRMAGLQALVIERTPRVGDVWRNRYPSLVLHDPVWANHLPYFPFPSFWPTYTPKDKLADWLESYATAMDLNVWTSSELITSAYDDETKLWKLVVRRGEDEVTVTAPHLVLSTGNAGPPRVPQLPNVDRFGGEVVHSTEFVGGLKRPGTKAVVVGASSSGHDIAADLVASGADVTMIQRSSTYVMSQANGIPALFGAIYFEGGPPLDDADLQMLSYPTSLALASAPDQTKAIAEADSELLEGLRSAGMLLDMGIDNGGLMSKALSTGGGYYIDVGTSAMIADGRIGIRAGAGLAGFTDDSVVLDDGTEFKADLVVLATGYHKMSHTVEAILGTEVAKRCGATWGMDEEGEIVGLWRPSGQPGLWFGSGSLMITRLYAKRLAIQLLGAQLGLNNRA